MRFIFKSPDQKGHVKSMNLLLKEIKTPYVWNCEDDWLFFLPKNYMTECFKVLAENSRYGQCLLNRCYGEDLKTSPGIAGGHRRYTSNGLRYYIHEYATGSALETIGKQLAVMGKGNCLYWPHYSLRVGLTRTAVFKEIGDYNETASHFEIEYAHRYRQRFLTTYLDNLYCIHIGRRTYERHEDKINAYDLNQEKQFGVDPKKINKLDNQEKEPEIKLDAISSKTNSLRQINRPPIFPIKTYVLNLKRRPDRLINFRRVNGEELVNFHIFEAVDGQLLTPCHTIQKLFESNDYNYRRGLVGCAMSHLLMWLELHTSSYLQGMLIIEDDAILTNNFLYKFSSLLADYPQADILFLGHHPYQKYAKNYDLNRDEMPIAERWTKEKSKQQSMGGTTAYYISKKGASNMINYLFKNGFRYGVDWEMFHNETNNVYYCSPFLAFAECFQSAGTKVDTDIQTVYDGVGYKDPEEWLSKEFQYWKGATKGENCLHYKETVCKKDLLETLNIFYYSQKIIDELNLYPVHWYKVDKYIFSIPDNHLSDDDIKNISFGGCLNIDGLFLFYDKFKQIQA